MFNVFVQQPSGSRCLCLDSRGCTFEPAKLIRVLTSSPRRRARENTRQVSQIYSVYKSAVYESKAHYLVRCNTSALFVISRSREIIGYIDVSRGNNRVRPLGEDLTDG